MHAADDGAVGEAVIGEAAAAAAAAAAEQWVWVVDYDGTVRVF